MIVPPLAAGMEQEGWVACFGVGGGDVASFEEIAPHAAKSKVFGYRFACMRDGDDMFDVESNVAVVFPTFDSTHSSPRHDQQRHGADWQRYTSRVAF
jgi:hypothetical protein